MKNFVEKYFTVIVFVILVLTFFKGCNDSRNINLSKKYTQESVIFMQDSMYNKIELQKILNLITLHQTKKSELEGLKAELRFYQSTNRTLMDVERQSELVILIDDLSDEINEIEVKLYETLDK